MTSYKLTYFNSKGLGEPIRFLLVYGNFEFEDIRVPLPPYGQPIALDQETKDKCPWGQVPVLEFDGKILAQSLPITRYLARRLNLVGADDFESAKCDEYTETIKEFNRDFFPVYMETDPAKKLKVTKSISENLSSKYFVKFEAIVEANGGKFLVGKNLTWADLYFANYVSFACDKFEWDFLEGFPNLKALVKNVFEVPQFKEWAERRPKTEY